MDPVILYRPSTPNEPEMLVAGSHLTVITQRTQVKPGQLVIPRYSLLPFARELQTDVENLGGKLINNFSEHEFVADLLTYYEVLGPEMTPRTWERVQDIPDQGPFVLKGQTNSRKHKWSTHMFANTKKEAVEVYLRLVDDPLFEKQNIYVRQYVPLKKLGDPVIDGAPVSLEYRFFFLNGKQLAAGFYWSDSVENGRYWRTGELIPGPEIIPQAFIDKTLGALDSRCPFVVVDFAIKEDGSPIVIELNDACMSGLSCIEPDTLYSALATALR